MCWGDNIEGQLGVGTGGNKDIPTLVTGITTATKIALGSDHSCAVLEDSKIKCCGSNGHGQLGNDGNTGSYNTPVQVLGITTATNVALGGDHSCALLMDATVTLLGKEPMGTARRWDNRPEKFPRHYGQRHHNGDGHCSKPRSWVCGIGGRNGPMLRIKPLWVAG